LERTPSGSTPMEKLVMRWLRKKKAQQKGATKTKKTNYISAYYILGK
jgi:hypothetical protein